MDHIVYSTTTGQQAVDHWTPEHEQRPPEPVYLVWEEAFCFVCGRCTDHVGEHDDLVEAGLATYDGGYVLNGEPR